MDIEEVGVLGGNSSAVRALVISLTIFLGALIGAILFGELMLYLYQRLTHRNKVEAKDGNCCPSTYNVTPRIHLFPCLFFLFYLIFLFAIMMSVYSCFHVHLNGGLNVLFPFGPTGAPH